MLFPFFWLLFSILHWAFAVPNAALVVLALTAVRKATIRERLLPRWRAWTAILQFAWLGAVGFLGFSVAVVSQHQPRPAIAAAAPPHSDDAQREAVYQTRLGELRRLAAQPAATADTYRGARAARVAFDRELNGDERFADLRNAADRLLASSAHSYAEELVEKARLALARNSPAEAAGLLREAVEVAPGLQKAPALLADALAQEERTTALTQSQPRVEEALRNLEAANALAKDGESMQADARIGEGLDALEQIPEAHRKWLPFPKAKARLDARRRQLKPSVDKERASLEEAKRLAAAMAALCGPSPLQSPWDGEILAVTDYVKRSAHDPDSIDVTNCTPPRLSRTECWTTACEVRGTNAFGAKVLNRMRFSIVRHPEMENHGVVVGARSL